MWGLLLMGFIVLFVVGRLIANMMALMDGNGPTGTTKGCGHYENFVCEKCMDSE